MTHRGRFAPSPTGRLHLGNVRSALLGWLWARAADGEFWLRIEDLDPDRSKPEFTDAIFQDLEWLGLTWDGPVWKQSERAPLYADALKTLASKGLAYRCWCSRAEVARAASAPHVGEDGPVYPGTCRNGAAPRPGRAPSWRFATSPEVTSFHDAWCGDVSQDVSREVGDFVIQRIDGVASYQLAVVVDDALAGVTHVLRGEDLLTSTPRQLLLQRALGYAQPEYAHVPLMLSADGKRLAKRDGPSTVAGLRELGWSPERVIGELAGSCGLHDGSPIRAAELVPGFALSKVRR